MSRQLSKGEIRRRQIAEATLDTIAEHGLGGFTVRAVAKRLPITDGTIFRHFKNKQEIVLAAMDVLEEELFTAALVDEVDPLARLRGFFEARARLLGGPRALGRLVFSEELAQAAGTEGFEKAAKWRARSHALILGCLSELAEDGRLRSDLPPAQLSRVVVGMLLAFSNERLLLHLTTDLEARIARCWGTLELLLFPCPSN
ncbi:MAG: hypothetical protein DRJ42_30735 [Deltaproteobacteria bacterium]|nr:MAG: hypothetical protein DRJ42_30735 [Deltaproteobacteria bacterium]